MTKKRERKIPVRRPLVLGALWLTISVAVVFAPGCYGRNCEGAVEVFGADAGQGRMVDENTWESSGIDEEWLWFPRQRYYVFDLTALGGRKPDIPTAYVSATPDPKKSNFVNASGNIAEFLNPRPNGIDVRNGTCSDYYLRLVIQLTPMPPHLSGGDAETRDASSNDAESADAGL